MNDNVNSNSDGCTVGNGFNARRVNPNLLLTTRETPVATTTHLLATDTADCTAVVSSLSSTIEPAAAAVEEASSTASCTDSSSNNNTTTNRFPLAQQTINNFETSSCCCCCGSQDEESSSHTNDIRRCKSQSSLLVVEPTAPLSEVTITTPNNSSDDSGNEDDNNNNDSNGEQIFISNSSHRRMAKDPLGIGVPLPVLPPRPITSAATSTTTTTSSTATATPISSHSDDLECGTIKAGVPVSIREEVNDDNQLRHTRPGGDALSTLTGHSTQTARSNKSQEDAPPAAATVAAAAAAAAQQHTNNVDSNNSNNQEPTPGAESTPPIILQRHVSMPGSYAIRGPGLPAAAIRSRVSSSHAVGLSNSSGHSTATTTAYSYYDDADDDPYSDGTEHHYPQGSTTMATTIRHSPSSGTLASMTSIGVGVGVGNDEQPSYLAEATLVTDDVSETDRDQQPQTQLQQQQERRGDEENQVIPSLLVHAEAKAISHRPRCLQAKFLLIGFCILLLTIVGMTIGFVIALHKVSSNNNDTENPQQVDTTASAAATTTQNQQDTMFVPTLERLRQEGILRCGRSGEFQRSMANLLNMVESRGQNQTSLSYLFPPDVFRGYCASIAAAALGNATAFELVETSNEKKYQMLANRSIDVLLTRSSMDMAQDVYEPSIGELYGNVGGGSGIAYSIPYQYTSTGFAGDPFYVDCADDILNQFRDCGGMMICANINMPFAEELQMLVPHRQLVLVDNAEAVIEDFMNGNCNLVAVESPETVVAVFQALGYAGELKVGTTSLATGMMAVNTLDRDPKWADFVNAVMMALLAAEEAGLTHSTAADRIGRTELFGEEYKDMFIRAIEARGQYLETYSVVVTRKGRNSLNDGTSGLLASPPLDDINSKQFHRYPRPINGGTLHKVKNRGFLNCGVHGDRPGFAAHNELSVWEGMDVDFCRALAASMFNGASYKATFFDVDSSGSNGFAMLQSDTIDVYAGAVWTLQNDIHEITTGEGYSFSQPYFYGPLNDTSFDENLCLVTRQNDAKWSSFVYWTAQSLVYAEEHGIDQRESNQMPLVEVFGPEMNRMLRDAIHAVGNYREVYQRHLASLLPRGGRNLLNLVQDNLPLRYLPPGLPFRS